MFELRFIQSANISSQIKTDLQRATRRGRCFPQLFSVEAISTHR